MFPTWYVKKVSWRIHSFQTFPSRFPPILARARSRIISIHTNRICFKLILFGANDACLSGSPTGQHVSLETYKKNTEVLLDRWSSVAQNPKILLVTPPPINETQLKEEDQKRGYSSLTREQENTARYAAAIREIAAEWKDRNVVLVDLWKALIKKAVQLSEDSTIDIETIGTIRAGDDKAMRTLLTDGLHLSSEAYKVFLDEVIPLVGAEWKDEPFDSPSWVFPHVREFSEALDHIPRGDLNSADITIVDSGPKIYASTGI